MFFLDNTCELQYRYNIVFLLRQCKNTEFQHNISTWVERQQKGEDYVTLENF